MVDAKKVESFSHYLNEVQDYVVRTLEVFEGSEDVDNIDKILFNLITLGTERELFQDTLKIKYLDDDVKVLPYDEGGNLDAMVLLPPLPEEVKEVAAVFSMTEVLLVQLITEKVDKSKKGGAIYNAEVVNNFVQKNSLSFINESNQVDDNNINPKIKKLIKWLIRIGNWTIKYSGSVVELGNMSVIEFIELLLEEAEICEDDDRIYERLEALQKFLEAADGILGNELLTEMMNNIEDIIKNKNKDLIKKVINDLRGALELILTPASWINKKSQEFADNIDTDQTPETDPTLTPMPS